MLAAVSATMEPCGGVVTAGENECRVEDTAIFAGANQVNVKLDHNLLRRAGHSGLASRPHRSGQTIWCPRAASLATGLRATSKALHRSRTRRRSLPQTFPSFGSGKARNRRAKRSGLTAP